MAHPANHALQPSDDGLALIEGFEGFAPDWYADPVGVPTIGFGWTGPLPDDLAPPLSRNDARRLLRQTVERYAQAVRDAIDVPLRQRSFDALVSFTYNVGVGALRSSTLRAKLNSGDVSGAAAEFDRGIFAGGHTLPGLVRRRRLERAWFQGIERHSPST